MKTTVLTEDIADRVASLIAQNRSRHGSPGGADLIRRILLAQRTTGLLDDAVVFLALRDRDLIAVLIAYPRGDRLYARYFGFDYAAATPACEYFVLSFHVAVDYAARAGFRRYRLSIEAWDTKIRHGAHLTPLAAVILPTRGVICTPAHQRELNIAAARRWRDRTRTRPQALDPEWDHWDSLAR